jgi:hypothetical protein
MYTPADAIAVARSQEGYHEGRTASGHWNNVEKFATLLPGMSWAQGQPWCAVFAHFVVWFVGVSVPPGALSASCGASVSAFKAHGRFTEYPVAGAIVFYGKDGAEHCGIVSTYDDTYVYTVEGNTNTSGGAEGDGVYAKKRVRRDNYVYGYGVPYYHATGHSPDPHWNGRDLTK